MKGNWEFDFTVRAGSPVVTVAPGGSASIPIVVDVRGRVQPIQLGVATDWGGAGVVAQVAPNVIPDGGAAILHVVVSAATPPGSYLIGVQGTTAGTFKTSQAMVTVVVTPKPAKQEQPKNGSDGDEPTLADHPPVGGKKAPTTKPAYGKMGPKPSPRGPVGFIMTLVVLVGLGFGLYYLDQQYNLIDSIFGSSSSSSSTIGDTIYEGQVQYFERNASGTYVLQNSGPGQVMVWDDGHTTLFIHGQVQGNTIVGYTHDQLGDHALTASYSHGVITGTCVDATTGQKWVFDFSKG